MSAETPVRPLSESDLRRSSLKFPVVGLGASAGGLEALLQFFRNMPAGSGMAFVVVVHLSPKHASNLTSVLQAVTPIRVVSADEATAIEADTIYVIPPNKMLSMNDGYVRVTDLDRPRGTQVVIDLFFRTLAVVHRERAMAVVLSGTGADGAVGITRIKEEGGVSIVQEPTEAQFDDMPRAAIATGTIDWVMRAADMPAKLMQIWSNAREIELPPAEDVPGKAPSSEQDTKLAEEALRDILAILRARTSHDFRNYKRATVLRRLERRLQVHGLPNLPAYRAFLQAQPEEAQALLKDLLIGVTNFFRDPEAFEALKKEALGPMFDGGDRQGANVRVWVAGCATGEEAYSVGILLSELAAAAPRAPKIHLFATDIDEAAVAHARTGVYPASIETDVTPARLRRFFEHDANRYQIRKEVREKMMFAVHNLLHDPPFSKLDLISCRNLLIYLDREVHAELLEMFHFALKPGGILFLGSSESADTASTFFSVVDKKHRIYRANVVQRTARYMPNLPMATSPGLAARHLDFRTLEKRRPGYADLHRRLAERHAPPSVLVDAEANIVHLSEDAGRFLRHSAGAPSHQLLSLVLPELRLELRSAVFQAVRTGQTVQARRVLVQLDGVERQVQMTAQPVKEPEVSTGPLVFVLFEEIDAALVAEPRPDPGERDDPLVVQLEDELTRTKEQLQNTIEHSETSTEELKASNEELQAINEELRSATEELETSKEELQSMNEELITVNQELKGKVEEMAKINDDLQNLIASTDIATLFVDRAMSIKRYTPHATKLFNLIPSDVGRSLLDITHRLDYDRLADDATEAFQSLRMIEREVSSQSGQWYLARVFPYRTTEDHIDGAVLTFVDITSRRRAEQTMRLIAESTKDFAIASFDLDGRITTWNQGAQTVFGYSDTEAIGQSVAMLFVPEDRAAGAVEEELRRARDNGRAEDDRWHLRKDGTRIFCSGITSPLREDGRHVGYAKIARDLTGSKRLERDRERQLQIEAAARAEAQAASELKDEFLAVMSHELKNPLNLIQLNADLLVRLPEARGLPAVERAAGIIRRTVAAQAQIIDDLLDLSRINTGKLTLTRSTVDWAGSVDMIVSAMQEEAASRGVALSIEKTAPLLIDADPVRVEQIVWNLLSNAVKFTPAGGKVALKLERDGECARLEVRDTGRGIAPDALPQVFEMFKQVEPSGARLQGGLGIGLAVVRHLVQLHGGRIEASSAGLGAGSTFTCWLPLAPVDTPAHENGATRPHRLARRQVLLVDDDHASVETLRHLLEGEGMGVEHAASGPEALEKARRHRFDVVLTDIAMPNMDGHALLRALREDGRYEDVPVLALTGMARADDVRRALDAGFRAHLSKPISADRLFAALDEVLAGSEAPSH